jgi:flagellar basal-body rod protein FlgG
MLLRGIYTSAAGLISTQQRQDITANNIANLDTTGYKQDKVATKTFPEVMIQNKDSGIGDFRYNRKLGTMSFGAKNDVIQTDFAQGSVNETGNKLDVAINGRGFFNVRFSDEQGTNIGYTRDGSFNTDSLGRVVYSGGLVLGRDVQTGQVGSMNVGNGDVYIDDKGNVFVDSVKRYTLVVSDFNDYNNLTKAGKNMYAANPNDPPTDISGQGDTFEIKQGFLENSNADMADEMISLMMNARAYSANQRVLTTIDETLGKSVNEVGALR